MSKEEKKDSKFNLFQITVAVIVIILSLALFLADRLIHVLLFHRDHERFGTWVKDRVNIKYALARLVIFLLPIIIYKIIF